MAIRGAAKRKHLDKEQETNKPKSKKPKAKSTTVGEEEDVDVDEGHDGRGVDEEEEYNDYEDSRSQQEMMLFEKKLKEIKKNKKTRSDNSTLKFKTKVKDNEEALLKSLEQQRLEIKYNAIAFSENLTMLLEKALNSSFSEFLMGPSSDTVQNRQQLHASQISVTDFPENLIASARSLQNIVTTISDQDLMIGEGWEQDGDLSISALREAQQASSLKLTEEISRDKDHNEEGGREEVSEMNWGSAVKRTENGIRRLLKNVPILADDVDGE